MGSILVGLCNRKTFTKPRRKPGFFYFILWTIPARYLLGGILHSPMSITLDTSGKPVAPRKDWPLTANGNGQWSKKHQGKVYYFGAWDDWRQAERNYARRWSAILSGLPDPGNEGAAPVAGPRSVALEVIVNLYLEARKKDRDRGDIRAKHYADMRRKLTWLCDTMGWRSVAVASLTPALWKRCRIRMEDEWGPDNRKTATALFRSVSKWADENGHCDAWAFGDELPIPSKAEIRANRRAKDKEHGEKLFPREQVKPIIDACGMPYEAMFLLALNAGFTAADIGALSLDALDLDNGWFEYDRVKTGVQRAGYLWPETVKAIREAMANRPEVDPRKLAEAVALWRAGKPSEGKEAIRRWQANEPKWDRLVFLTRFGQPFWRQYATIDAKGKDNASMVDSVGYEFARILRRLDKANPNGVGGMKFKRGRVSFATGRHTFFSAARTIDHDVAQFIQGHTDDTMGAWYDHLDDSKLERLQAVSDALRSYFLTQASEGTALRRPLRLGAGRDARAVAS